MIIDILVVLSEALDPAFVNVTLPFLAKWTKWVGPSFQFARQLYAADHVFRVVILSLGIVIFKSLIKVI